MIVCPSCGKTNGDGRRHCNWCGCYLPPLLREEDRAVPWMPNTWSNLAMLRVEQELIESERRMRRAEPKIRLGEYERQRLVELLDESRMNHATATVLYDDMQEQILVCGDGGIVRVIR